MVEDPYKYFRIEAKELLEGLTQGVLGLEKGGEGKERVGRILRLTHTLKGAARVVKQRGIADLAHAIEEALAPYRETHAAVERQGLNQVLGLVDAITAQVKALDAPQKSEAPQEATFATVRVDLEEMDTLLRSASAASVQLTALRQSTGDAAATIEQLGRELVQVQEAATRVRLLPAKAIFFSLERAARDAAQTLHKQVDLIAVGGDSRLDTHILAAVGDALLHVVRNAVAHGIEAASERVAAGKNPLGRVELAVERRGARVAFICRDDGRGIDVEAVRRTATRQGLLTAQQTITMADAVRLLLQGGLTTTAAANQVSGRGIGLDVVREIAAGLGGELAVQSDPGKGTTVEICVPISLSSLTALHLEVAGSVVSIPLDAVKQTLRISEKDLLKSANGDALAYEGKIIPFLPLSAALRKKMRSSSHARSWSAVVIDSGAGAVALGADRLAGTSSVVVRPMPALAAVDAIVVGASIDAEGNPQLMLDPRALAASAQREHPETNGALAPARRAPILIIDDSLTTRMLEQSILESAGYEVELATSAEEGLLKARTKTYALFLVDVEMPGMSGFEFVAQTQSDPQLHAIPAILVTSRNAPADRRRGEDVGARAYIVKGEFDQVYLLQTIRELTND